MLTGIDNHLIDEFAVVFAYGATNGRSLNELRPGTYDDDYFDLPRFLYYKFRHSECSLPTVQVRQNYSFLVNSKMEEWKNG
jgi:hypothetical protein